LVLTYVLVTVLPACKNGSKKEVIKSSPQIIQDTIPAVYKKPPSSYSDTLVIRGEAAVFFNPDTLQLDKIKRVRKKLDFESDTHDCFFQQRNARIVLKQYWPQIKIIETSKARFLLFIYNDGTQTLTDLDAKNDMCGIFLFNGKKGPELTDMTNIDTGLEYYFKK
jgi:hypothetical protein